jgi:hypothetical protein
MVWLKAVLGARWFPYVLIGSVTAVTAVFGYGYMKGYNSAEVSYQEAMNEALKSQYARMLTQSETERKLALKAQRRKYEIRSNVNSVSTPSTDCTLPYECVQWYDDILRAADSHSEGTD